MTTIVLAFLHAKYNINFSLLYVGSILSDIIFWCELSVVLQAFAQ